MTVLDQLLALDGRTRADLPTTGLMGRMVRGQGVAADQEFARVAALPRRQPVTEAEIDAVSQALRKRERNEKGKVNRLRPAQVEALRELFEVRGLFAHMGTGQGKTLITLLAPTLLGAQRPVLMVPGGVTDELKAEFAKYYDDWHVRLPKVVSYQLIQHHLHENDLIEAAPDLLILDEADYVRNLGSARSRRVERAVQACRPMVACLSATMITPQLLDYHHLAVWSLGHNAPVPMALNIAEQWAKATDRDVGMLKRWASGALEALPGGFHEWLRGSRGVVSAPEASCNAKIRMSKWQPKMPEILTETIKRTIETQARPDGEELTQWDLPDCLCQIALGFYYIWDPLPPDWWLRPRKGIRAYYSAVLDEHLVGFDSPAQIAMALDRPGPYEETEWVYPPEVETFIRANPEFEPPDAWATPRTVIRPGRPQPPAADEGRELLAAWRAVKDHFEPNPVPVWLNTSVIEQAAATAGTHGCLIWVKYRAVGHKFEELGVPYYGANTRPQNAKGNQTIALSIEAHGTGRNLQAWHRNLLTTLPANARACEQLVGRTHRAGQEADPIEFLVPDLIPYHGDVLKRVLAEARATGRALGSPQKIVTADWQ